MQTNKQYLLSRRFILRNEQRKYELLKEHASDKEKAAKAQLRELSGLIKACD